MKKFFALMLTVAMLLVAGSAMAASPVVTVSATSLTIKAGGTVTSLNVSASAANGGTITGMKVSGATWATLTNNTLMLNPSASVAAGQYTLAVSATETYTASGAGGHGSFPMTATGRALITVSVLGAEATGTQVVVKVTEVVTTVTKTVTIISAAARESAVVETFEEATSTTAEKFTPENLGKVKGFQYAATWGTSEKAAEVETKKKATTDTMSTSAGRSNVFKHSKVPANASEESFKLKENTILQPATSSVSSDATRDQKLAASTAASGGENNDNKGISHMDAVMSPEDGTFAFPQTYGSDLYGTKIGGSRNRQNRTPTNVVSFTVSAMADDDEGIAFLNSSGDVVNVIPDDSDPENIMPGFVNMLVVMKAGEVYEPVVYATKADLEASGVAIDTNSVDVVVVDAVAEETTEVVVDVNADGSVGEETVVEKADTVTETAIAVAMGANTVTMVPASSYGTVISQDKLLEEFALALSNDLHVAASFARPFNNLGTGTYYYVISFDALPTARTLASGAQFEFYPDGFSEGTTAYFKVFNEEGTEVTNPSSILGKTGIVAFEITSDNGIRTSNFDNTLANPTVAIKMNPIGGGSGSGDVVTDAEISRLRTAGYISSSNVLQSAAYLSGSKPAFTQSGDFYVMNIALKSDFTVDTWSATCGGTALTASAITGTIKKTSNTSATVQINRTTLPDGNSTVVVTMHPTAAAAGNTVSDSWTVSYSSPTGDVGVGSSSGGCSAGSAVLALALLGVFIARKK